MLDVRRQLNAGEVCKVFKVRKACRVFKALKELKGRRVCKVFKAHKEFRVFKVLKEPKEPKEPKVVKAHKAFKEFKVLKVLKEPKELRRGPDGSAAGREPSPFQNVHVFLYLELAISFVCDPHRDHRSG